MRAVLILIFLLVLIVIYSMIRTNTGGRFKDRDREFDAVVTWVDTSDKKWQKSFEKMKKKEDPDIHSVSVLRFQDPSIAAIEINLCLDLIMRNLKGVRKVFIVTRSSQRPKGIEKYGDKVQVVHHEQFIPPNFLPTFDSDLIEGFLDKIPGLLEKFVYFNDDMYLIKSHGYSSFFNESNPIIPCELAKLYSDSHTWGYQMRWNKLIELLEPFGPVYRYDHGPTPLTKNLMKRARNRFGKQWLEFSKSHFRSTGGLPTVGTAVALGVNEGGCCLPSLLGKLPYLHCWVNHGKVSPSEIEHNTEYDTMCLNNVDNTKMFHVDRAMRRLFL